LSRKENIVVEWTIALPHVVVAVVVLVAAGTDLWKFRIYNVLTIPSIILGLIYHTFARGEIGLSGSILGVVVANVAFIAPYKLGGIGAGDLKLMSVVGAWLGPWYLLHVIAVSGLATGCLSFVLMFWNRMRSEYGPTERAVLRGTAIEYEVNAKVLHIQTVLDLPKRRLHVVPFGAMVALGVLVTELWIG